MQRYRAAALVTDIEGTTSSLAFVKDTLFPYARARLAEYVAAHPDAVAGLTPTEALATLHRWMDEDKKDTTLKKIQGDIWAAGYAKGDLRGHLYPDAYAFLQTVRQRLPLYIYSSGSVAAQKLLFGHTEYGDLTGWFRGYFDTSMGAKVEAGSYTAIAAHMGLPPARLLFVSDNIKEIGAAKAAGWQVCHIVRDGEGVRPSAAIADFTELEVSPDEN